MDSKFPIGVDMTRVISTLAEQIYDTHLAFLRENVQNAIDAIRIQARRDAAASRRDDYMVVIEVSGTTVRISDNGIGMTLDEQRTFFWTMGASGKNNKEARDAGCIGSFGIGGFANAGVCTSLKVTSRSADARVAHWTKFVFADLKTATASKLPEVKSGVDRHFSGRGTMLEAELKEPPKVDELRRFIQDCVRYADERVTFNGQVISRQKLSVQNAAAGTLTLLTRGSTETLQPAAEDRNRQRSRLQKISCRWYEDAEHTLYAELLGMTVDGANARLGGYAKIRRGNTEIRRRGFKICSVNNRTFTLSHPVPEQLDLSGVIEADVLSPTAGRESLDEKSESLLSAICNLLRDEAASRILESSDRIAQYPEIYNYITLRPERLHMLGMVKVPLTGGDESTLEAIKSEAAKGIKIFFSRERNGIVASHLKAAGSIVVELPTDYQRGKPIRQYLETLCKAASADDQVQCVEDYPDSSFTKFDRIFLNELEEVIISSYNIATVTMHAGKLSSDLAAYATNASEGKLELYVDLRHPQVTKLHGMPATMMGTAARFFCMELIGEALRRASPRFYSDGSSAFAKFFKNRAEEWILVRGEIIEFGRRDIHDIGRDDVWTPEPGHAPKIVYCRPGWYDGFLGHYLRMPGGLVKAYMNEIQDHPLRAATWIGNQIALIVSDGVTTSYGIQIKLDSLVQDSDGGRGRPGSTVIEPRLLSIYGELYFPIPKQIEPALIPARSETIRIAVSYDMLE
jgi:molecular chaperone HtpG